MRSLFFLLPAAVLLLEVEAKAADKPRPMMKDFIGLCVHTVQFKPELYAPVARMVRDYHPFKWDVGDDTGFSTKLPMARNGVDWSGLYGKWSKAGYRIDADIMFDDLDSKKWHDASQDSFAYGRSFAHAFGPSSGGPVECMEIGNEPGKYEDAAYREIFKGMARGAREGDPRMRIATCAANLGPSGRYSKSVDLLSGLTALYDIINIHIYAEVEGWPTWRRSYPEDPKIGFLSDLGHVLKWREQNAPDKEVWMTEFGWDASTKPPPASGDFAKWEGSTEVQQAEWIVRGFLVLSATTLDRAYLYFFNDEDEPHVHGSSGLTRHFQPKPSFFALSHLQSTLGEFHFARAVQSDPAAGFIYEFVAEKDPFYRVSVIWKPTGPSGEMIVPVAGDRIIKAERMPLTSEKPEPVPWQVDGGGKAVRIPAGEAPVYISWRAE